MQRKIACSYYNSAAINEKDELYLWGSIQSGILGNTRVKPLETPKKFPLTQVNPFFKALHVSCGPNHIAVLIGNVFLDKVDTNKYVDPIHKEMLRKQGELIKERGINMIEEYDLAKQQTKTKQEFENIIESFDGLIDYTKEEMDEVENLIDYFTEEDDKINFVQYVYSLDPSLFETNRVVTWGLKENGKLGHATPEEAENPSVRGSIGKSQSLQDDASVNTVEAQKILQKYYAAPKVVPIPYQVKKVSCGHKFTIALDMNGEIWTWGQGSNGCLGTGNLHDCWEPMKIDPEIFGKYPSQQKIVDISAGSEHCLAINRDCEAFSWGTGKFGRLGHGNEISELKPKKIQFFNNQEVRVKSIECGEVHSGCISSKDVMYTWGCGANYRLGHGSLNNELVPKQILNMSEHYIIQMSLGLQHSMCRTVDGHIFAWGYGMGGRLGIDMVSNQDYLIPTRVGAVNDDFKKKEFQEICAGPFQSFGLTIYGELYAWGSKKFKTLGIPDLKYDVYFPIMLGIGSNLKFFFTADRHTDGLDPNKVVKFDAYNLDYEEYNPQNEDDPPFKIAKVFSGETNTAFLTVNGDLFMTGSGVYGQLGLNPDVNKEEQRAEITPNLFWEGDMFYSYTPLYHPANLTIKFKHVALGLNHVVGITREGKAYSWGKNSEAQLGHGYVSKFVNRPLLIEDLSLKTFGMAMASHSYSAFVSDEGELYVCGTAEYGCLGVNNTKQNYDIFSPKLVNNLPPVKYVAGGPQHMVAITTEGELYVWGNANNGRCGLKVPNEKILTPKPVKVVSSQGPVKFNQASCGFMHTLLLDIEGIIWATGAKAYAGFPSEDGYRSFEEQNGFKVIPDLANMKFIEISSGEFHNLAIRAESFQVYGWGRSEYGKLAQDTFLSYGDGDNKLKNILLPKRIDGVDNVAHISCGVNHSVSVGEDGDVYVWGCVLNGRLGISKEDLKLLKHQRLLKTESNIQSLNTPKQLQTGLEEEFETRLNIYTHEGKKEFLGLNIVACKRAVDIVNAIADERKKLEMEARKRQNFGEEEVQRNSMAEILLMKKFSSLDVYSREHEDQFSASLQNQSTRGFGSDLKTKTSQIAGSNNSSPLFEKKEEFETPVRSRFSIMPSESAIPRQTQNEEQATFNFAATANQKNEQANVVQNYMNLVAPNAQEEQYDQMLFQKLLQEEESENLELALTSRDLDLAKGFRAFFTKVSEELKKTSTLICNQVLESEAIIQTSLHMIPKKIKKIKNMPLKIPSFILQNVQLYEGIISVLFDHPCYFHKMLKSNLIEKNIVLDWIFKVYGTHTEDERVINQVLALGLMSLEEEVEAYSIKQQSVIKLMCSYVKMYDFIQSHQFENMRFLKELAEHLINTLIIKDNHPDYNMFRPRQSTKNRGGFSDDDGTPTVSRHGVEYMMEGNVKDFFNVEYFIKHRNEAGREPAQIVFERSKILLEKFDKNLRSILSRPDFSEMGKISPQIRHFNARILEEYKKFATSKLKERGTNVKYTNADISATIRRAEFLILELFFGKISDIVVNYKEYGIKVPKEYEDILSPQNLSSIGFLLTKYFQKEEIAPGNQFAVLNDFININSKNTQMITSLIKGVTADEGFDLTFDYLLKTLDDSIKSKDRYNSFLSVKDIINIQNFLIKNRKNHNLLLREEDDPIYVITDYLKDNYQSLNHFSFDMLAYKVNLKITSKIRDGFGGENDSKLNRCNYCQLILPRQLLRIEDVRILEETQWTCHKCSYKTDFPKQKCDSCGLLIQEYKYQRRSIFKRYIPLLSKDQNLTNYVYWIKTSPKIRSNSDMVLLIQEKIQTSIKLERFDVSSEFSKILKTFNNFDVASLARDYSIRVSEIQNTNELINFIHEIFCDEFQIRRQHKKYLDQLERLLNRAYQILANESQNGEILTRNLENMTARIGVSKGKFNGLISRVFTKPGEDQEVEMKQTLKMENSKPYATFNSQDLKSQKVLASLLLHGKSVPKVIDNLKFYVFYQKGFGFNIKIVYLDDSWQNMLVRFGPWFTNEVALGEMRITPEHFIEMRRLINYKGETTLGYATFYCENLVNMLNGILIQNYARKMKVKLK